MANYKVSDKSLNKNINTNKISKIKVVLIGLPNVGKTTLFNFLTKNCKKTGNYSGKTLDYETSVINCDSMVLEIIDTPGIESLHENEIFEFVNKFKSKLNIDEKILFVQVIDSTKLRKSLILTHKLLNFLDKKQLFLFFSMTDIKKVFNDDFVNLVNKISKYFDLDFLIADYKNHNFSKKIVQEILNHSIKYDENYDENFSNVKTNLLDEGKALKENELFNLLNELDNSLTKRNKIDIDSFLLHPIFGIIVFFIIMFSVFFISNLVSEIFSSVFLDPLSNLLIQLIRDTFQNSFFSDFLTHTLIVGLFSILSLFPSMLLIIFFILVLEHSGYVIRPMLLFHNLFKALNLQEKAIVPIILGFSCNVPGILATKKSNNEINFLVTIFSIPSIICSARFIVLLFFAKLLFPNNEVIVIFLMYLLSILSILITVRITKLFFSSSLDYVHENSLIEIPEIRVPNINFLFKDLYSLTKQFAYKLFSILLLGTVLIYLISKLPSNQIEFSYAAQIGNIVIYPLKLLGINSWQLGVAILNGIIGKELIISSISMTYLSQSVYEEDLSHNNNLEQLRLLMANDLDSLNSKLALIAFILFYNPCLPTTIAIFTKLENLKRTLFYVIYSFALAYFMAIIAFVFASLIF